MNEYPCHFNENIYDALGEKDIRNENLFKSTNIFIEGKVIDILNLSTEVNYICEILNGIISLFLS